jgi:hypothetical protein
MPIEEQITPAVEPNIFLLSTTELSVLKENLDKINQEKLSCEEKIESIFSQLETKLLQKIPEDHNILKIINSKIKSKGNRTILECFLEGTFDREKVCLRKSGYTVRIFLTVMPIVINQQELLVLVDEVNNFWSGNLNLTVSVYYPYKCFSFTWL